ncbi:DUF1971 domain-containing protein [Ilumatobacter sp.]|uniref:DUF1971 domain-containing protein n=1 Tax=Ilumatobacter sp. TaxID=1967498 RepID=UPI003C3EE713
MTEPVLPAHLVEARRTPLFDFRSLPDPLAESHRTTVWAQMLVQAGSVRYIDLDGEERRDVIIEAGDGAAIVPGIEHMVEPSTDAQFFIQFYREPDAPIVPGEVPADARHRSGPWEHRGRDLDTTDEIFEMVTRQYVDVVQDELLEPYFDFEPGFIDWQSHIATVADYWCHVLLYTPDYEVDVIEIHRHLHEHAAFTPELIDRWLQVFEDTVDGGWTGPNTEHAKKLAIGVSWAMAHRLLGPGVWVHPRNREL